MKIDFGNIFKNWKQTLFRFPVPVVLSIFLTVFICLLIGNYYSNDQESFAIIMSSVLTFLFTLGIKITSENAQLSSKKSDILQIISLILGVGYYFSIRYTGYDSLENIILFFLLFACFIGILYFAPFVGNIFNKKYKEERFHAYFLKLSYVIVSSSILGGIISIGGIIALLSVKTLFDIPSFPDNLFGYWITFSLAFFAPFYGLSSLPTSEEITASEAGKNKFFSFLVRFVAIPFIYVYFVILYAYSIKVLLHFSDWPKGEVSWMVIGFSVFGYFAYLFSYGLQETNILIKYFRKFFPIIVIPQIAMLFYAIYLRIAQYDLTVNRYFVVIFGIWLLGISLYYFFSKEKKGIFIPLSLSLTTLIISIGPWSVFSYPAERQYQRLIQDLTTANILQNGVIVPLQTGKEITAELSGNIYSEINYICEFNKCEQLKILFAKQLEENYNSRKNDQYFSHSSWNDYGKWEIVSAITQAIKVEYQYRNDVHMEPTIYINMNYENRFPLDISGYETLIELGDTKTKNISANINTSLKTLTISENNEITVSIPLEEMYENITKSYFEQKSTNLEKDKLIFEFSPEKYKIKLILHNINIPNPEYTSQDKNSMYDFYNSVNGYVLISKK